MSGVENPVCQAAASSIHDLTGTRAAGSHPEQVQAM